MPMPMPMPMPSGQGMSGGQGNSTAQENPSSRGMGGGQGMSGGQGMMMMPIPPMMPMPMAAGQGMSGDQANSTAQENPSSRGMGDGQAMSGGQGMMMMPPPPMMPMPMPMPAGQGMSGDQVNSTAQENPSSRGMGGGHGMAMAGQVPKSLKPDKCEQVHEGDSYVCLAKSGQNCYVSNGGKMPCANQTANCMIMCTPEEEMCVRKIEECYKEKDNYVQKKCRSEAIESYVCQMASMEDCSNTLERCKAPCQKKDPHCNFYITQCEEDYLVRDPCV